MVEFDREFKKKYPHLSREIEESLGESRVPVGGIRQRASKGEENVEKQERFQGYSPGAVDFLRRCRTEEEGMEVIGYLEKRGEISANYALELRSQLLQHGIRSFGERKEKWNHYK